MAEELGAEVLPVSVKEEWNITGSLLSGYDAPVYRFLPGMSRGEGLFMAVLRKRGDGVELDTKKKDKRGKRERQKSAKANASAACLQWLSSPDDYDLVSDGDAIAAIPKVWRSVYDTAKQTLKVMTAGVPLGETKGKDIIPAHGLALSTAFDATKFPKAELTYAQAICYLRKESITLGADLPRGYVVVTFKGVPLGFVKNIGNRANNLYPQEWKIRSSHMPEAYKEVVTPIM